jgi:hypothetical protein
MYKNTLTFSMDLRKSALYLPGILILLNGMTDGTILQNTVNTLTSEDKAVFRSEIYCILGLLIYSPVRDVWGLHIPCPSFWDLSISTAITTAIIWLLHITGHTQGWKRVLEILVIVWILFKIFGLFLIFYSGDTCITA